MRSFMVFLIVLGMGILVSQQSQTETQPQRQKPSQKNSKPNAERSALIRRGKYLANSVAMCVACHSPRDAAGQLDPQRLFQGGTIPLRSPFPNDVWAIRAPQIAGLPGRSEQDLAQLLETGVDSRGWSPRRPMPPFRFSAEDAAAVAAYLRSLR